MWKAFAELDRCWLENANASHGLRQADGCAPVGGHSKTSFCDFWTNFQAASGLRVPKSFSTISS
jgi:hypothetical protein